MAEQHGKALVPQIRFAGFTDPWEQRKLGELSNEFKSGEFICADNVSVSGSYPVYGGNGLRGYTTTFNHEGLYTLIGRQGALCGNVNIADGKSYFTEHAVAVKANHLNDTTFLYYLFGTLDLGQYSGQSAQPGLAVSNLVEVEAMVPDKAEQKKISRVFKTVDSLITLHQRKYDKLCVLKKSMLDKMFPKGGSLYPEIRFAGFTDPWEQRKLGELYKEVSEKNDLTYGRDRIISVAHMYFNPVVYVTEDDYLKTYNVMRLGDIAFEGNRSKNFAHGRLVENTIGDGIVSHVFKVFRPIRPFDLMYWKYSINNEKAMKDVLTRSTKASTMMHELVAKDFLNEEIAVPSLEEQRQIGAFFDRLDSLITLHQRKLELLRNIKKSMLDKMFV